MKAFKIFILLTLVFLSFPKKILAQTAIGNCGGNSGTQVAPGIFTNWGYVSGPGVYWSTLEPQRGKFEFDKPPIDPKTGQPYIFCGTKKPFKTLKQIIDEVPLGQKIWLQVVTDTGACPKYGKCDNVPWPEPSTIPQWAIDLGVPSLYNPEAKALCGNNPSQWDPKYRELLGELLTALAKEYDNDPKVEAFIMMSGGLWGEGALPYHEYGDCATAIKNPDNVWVKEMARIWLGSSSKANDLLKPCNGFNYCFDYYYVESIKKLIDMYANTFSKPVVLQLGSGTSCDGNVSGATAAYAANTYGPKVWLKQNGFGNPTSGTYFSIFNKHKTKTRIIEEVGWPELWANAPAHNNDMVTKAIENGVSAACFYTEPLTNSTKYPINWTALKTGLVQNYNNLYLKIPSKNLYCCKANCDANGDGKANLFDFEIWRREFLKLSTTTNADFDCNGTIDINDFETWRRNLKTY